MTNLRLAYLNRAALSQTPAEENSGNSILLLKYLKKPVLSLCSQRWFSKLDRQPQASNYTSLIQGNWAGVQFRFCNLHVDLHVCWLKQRDFRKWRISTLSESHFWRRGSLSRRSRLVWENWEESQSSRSGSCTTFLHWVNFCSEFNTESNRNLELGGGLNMFKFLWHNFLLPLVKLEDVYRRKTGRLQNSLLV